MSTHKKILLIEDDENKRTSVLNVLRRSLRDSLFETVHSVRKAIDALDRQPFDLIVADMSLPTFDIQVRERGGTPRPFGGIEVFDHLDRIESSTPVIVVTSYPVLTDGKKSLSFHDLETQLKRDFPKNFSGLVYFDSAYANWEHELIDKVTAVF